MKYFYHSMLTILICSCAVASKSEATRSPASSEEFKDELLQVTAQNYQAAMSEKGDIVVTHLEFEDGDNMYIALRTANYMGPYASDDESLFLIDFSYLEKSGDFLKSNRFAVGTRFLIQRADGKLEYLSTDGTSYPLVKLQHLHESDFRVDSSLRGHIQSYVERFKEQEVIADRSATSSGPMGACTFEGVRGNECIFLKESMCNKSGVLKFVSLPRSTVDFSFSAGQTCTN